MLILLAGMLAWCSTSSRAQTLGGGVILNGQTNAVINPPATNSTPVALPTKVVTYGNVAFTNEFWTEWYCVQVPGFTNLFPLWMFQHNSVAGTNNGTLNFTDIPPTVSFTFVPVILVSNGPAITGPTNTVFIP